MDAMRARVMARSPRPGVGHPARRCVGASSTSNDSEKMGHASSLFQQARKGPAMPTSTSPLFRCSSNCEPLPRFSLSLSAGQARNSSTSTDPSSRRSTVRESPSARERTSPAATERATDFADNALS